MAQADSTLSFLQFPVPPFNIIKAPDSTRFTKSDLSKKKPTVIIIFSPDCEHCQHETKELTGHIDLFKKAQIVMASTMEYSYIKKFSMFKCALQILANFPQWQQLKYLSWKCAKGVEGEKT